MCGIVGVFGSSDTGLGRAQRQLFESLLKVAESRGKEAAGVAIQTAKEISIYKAAERASRMLVEKEYQKLWSEVSNVAASKEAVIGHSRLVTNGSEEHTQNNQPVYRDGIVVIHNGIITNVDSLWARYPMLVRHAEVDTEIIPALLRMFLDECDDLPMAVSRLFGEVEGTASFAALFADRGCLLLATNNGSLYRAKTPAWSCVFASERSFLHRALSRSEGMGTIHQIPPRHFTIETIGGDSSPVLNINDVAYSPPRSPEIRLVTEISSDPSARPHTSIPVPQIIPASRWREFELDFQSIHSLRRCTRGVLPETMPFISFDEQGVSNYAREYRKHPIQGEQALETVVAPLRDRDAASCLVAFSGGRDSSYALYYLKRVLGLNPVAYTYDWGMITDLARRNQARLCGNMGIEHIVVSADIALKRSNIRKNVLAWLKRPLLGTIPLFMAGDKQYFYHANRLQKETGAPAIVLAANPYERTHFKAGFCGVEPAFANRPSLASQMTMLMFYSRAFLQNPAYLNSSMLDTLGAFLSYYTLPHDYLRLFDYVRWNEREVDDVLSREFNWEHATDTLSTWRIGDGTAAFYNYIFLHVAGFTENDSLRHNQIMEGELTRDEALAAVERDNQPRFESIQWYCQVLGLDPLEVLRQIKRIPRLYGASRA